MGAFSLRVEFDESQSVDLVPDFVRPFGPGEIRALEASDTATLDLELQGLNARVNDEIKSGRATIKAKVTFNKPTIVFALVPGGWVPMPFTIPARFLVDRNVVISLGKIRAGKVVANAESLVWWTQFFTKSGAVFNPLPYAMEAGFQRKPTMQEFMTAYDQGASELLQSLPQCQVTKFEESNYRAAYAQLEAFDQRTDNEVAFLRAVSPIVVPRTSRREEWSMVDQVLDTADKCRVARASLVSLAALSCIFEHTHGDPPAIGRQVLKPKPSYTDAMAFNALSDLRHIELAAAGQTLFKGDGFALCTCDRALALLWSALSLRGEFAENDRVEFTFDLTEQMFQRLSNEELVRLKGLVCK
jgi:hypothetical protein